MNEKQYTEQVVMPLLRYIGFTDVTYNNGPDEYGKDVVFAEYDRFGNKKFYAAQIKVGDISGGNNSQCNDLIDHASNAFGMPYHDLIEKGDVFISDFFIIISGKFVGNAKEKVLKDKKIDSYKHRIHFYEGSHIDDFKKKNYQQMRELLVAVLKELQRNHHLASSVISNISSEQTLLAQYLMDHLPDLMKMLLVSGLYASLYDNCELYHQYLIRCNTMISLTPVLKVLRGDKEERTLLFNEAKVIKRIGQDLITKIKELLREATL